MMPKVPLEPEDSTLSNIKMQCTGSYQFCSHISRGDITFQTRFEASAAPSESVMMSCKRTARYLRSKKCMKYSAEPGDDPCEIIGWSDSDF